MTNFSLSAQTFYTSQTQSTAADRLKGSKQSRAAALQNYCYFSIEFLNTLKTVFQVFKVLALYWSWCGKTQNQKQLTLINLYHLESDLRRLSRKTGTVRIGGKTVFAPVGISGEGLCQKGWQAKQREAQN